MEPNPEKIAIKRQVALAIVRSLALLMFVIGSMPLAYHAAYWSFRPWTFVTLNLSEVLGLATMFILPGVVLIVSDRRLVRWLITIPRDECPQCGYTLKHLTTARCPECGHAFAAPSDHEPSPPR